MRTAPDSSRASGVKGHASHKGHKGDKGPQRMTVIELKSIAALMDVHAKQLLTQLRLSGLKLGLLINFGEAHLKNGIKRVINGMINETQPSDITL
jgi:GxxExxY protein